MRIAIVAGETSGDGIAAGLIRATRKLYPRARFEGVCGPGMRAAGCLPLADIEQLSVMGFVEVAGRYRSILALRGTLINRWKADPPDVFVGVDAPDFNLPLGARLRPAGITTVQYVSPAVWAWRRGRVRRIRESVDRMLVLLPFEAPFYARNGIAADYVGHPLANDIPEIQDRGAARQRFGLAAPRRVVALLPGSRIGEVRSLAPMMFDAAAELRGRDANLAFLMPAANAICADAIAEIRRAHPAGDAVTVTDGDARAVMAAADCVVLASGTATLEAMLINRPMVIVYRMHPVTYRLMRHMMRRNIPFIGLPNLLAGAYVVPELLQHHATPGRVARAVLDWLDYPGRGHRLARRFAQIRRLLARDADQRAAHAVIEAARR